MDVAESCDTHPPFPLNEYIFHAIEFDFIDILVDDACGDSQALGGEFESLAADSEIPPNDMDRRDDQSEKGRWKKDASSDDPDRNEDSQTEVTHINPLRWAAFPESGFVVHLKSLDDIGRKAIVNNSLLVILSIYGRSLRSDMGELFEEIDFRETPMGDLILQRRKYLQLDGLDVYEVKLGDAFLMSSMFHEVEEALSRLGLAALDGDGWDVVVGGLGLGYTAVAALEVSGVRELLVVDAMEGVIDWHERELVPLGKVMNDDSRCRYVLGDFFELAANPGKGFDSEQAGRKFHAVLLDIDHSPRNLLAAQNADFYTPEGLGKLAEQLHPGGVFALWSDDAPDEMFIANLEKIFREVGAEVVKFPNPLLDSVSESTVYVAKL